MAKRNDWQDLEENGQLGDWCFFDGSDNRKYIAFRYPHSGTKDYPPEYLEDYRGQIGHVPISTGAVESKCWHWDGNVEAPTISPSINIVGEWHGFIRSGQLETV